MIKVRFIYFTRSVCLSLNDVTAWTHVPPQLEFSLLSLINILHNL